MGNGLITYESFKDSVNRNYERMLALREKYDYDEKRIRRMKKAATKRKNSYMPDDWDIAYYYDIMNGDGFDILSPPDTILDEIDGDPANMYGPLSPLYGAIHTHTESYLMRFHCGCGILHGKANEGRKCEYCGGIVEERKTSPKKTGWVSLPNEHFIISPYYYNLFDSILGTKGGESIFEQIVKVAWNVDADGNIFEVAGDEIQGIDKVKILSQYAGLGIKRFRQHFDEIIDFYLDKFKRTPKKCAKLLFIKGRKKEVFISHIPVYSPMFRPQSLSGETFYHTDYDRKIVNPIISTSFLLDDSNNISTPRILEDIQKRVNSMVAENNTQIQGKHGWVQGNLFAGRNNYVARDVIIPDITLRDNEIDLCYITFLEMFQFRIMEHLKRMFGMRHQEAENTIFLAQLVFSHQVYLVMKYMVEEEGVYCVINRNPSLWMKSVLRMKVRHIDPSIDDFALVLPVPILDGLNADFDGDIMNMKACIVPETAYAFRKFDPIRSYIIDAVSGTIDRSYLPIKNTLADLIGFSMV